ncbi:hypothetical protein PVAND_007031 [Polypedilum vanderplanki]|uniref:Peptidase M14 domain-containing protein n=1 Tax=Polypedilum vanderplanki TaxID=319348 RepID=A0A9J6C501_POLVA|nr:hypothetical protein PVAND_007031 [Polypedilum vanderplanki]
MRVVILISLVVAVLSAPIRQSNDISQLHTLDFNSYWTYDEIVDYMRQLETDHPNIARVMQMGRTERGVEIWGLRIVLEEHLETEELPVVLVTAGAIARDWIAVMSAVDVMHMLVEHYHSYGPIVDNLEWFIIPVANPDGYIFSMETEENRGWVKNRRVNSGSQCIGVNIERNFDYNWGTGIGSSDDPCDDNFYGPAADSEEETKTIQFAVDIFRRIQHAYISIQANTVGFNGAITFPYASSPEGIPNNWEEQGLVAAQMSTAVRRETGARYLTASFSNIQEPADGTSMDYAVGVDNIPLAYTIFTPAAGEFGWDVPAWRINPIVDQVWYAVESLARYAVDMPLENTSV